jgi:hypothetical protein
MASAKKCDICGELYEIPPYNDPVRIYLDFGYLGDRHVDLCEDCYNRLCVFLNPTLPKGVSVRRKKAVDGGDQR